MLSLGRIRADRGAVDLQTLEPSSVPDKTLITIFVDLEIAQRETGSHRRTPRRVFDREAGDRRLRAGHGK